MVGHHTNAHFIQTATHLASPGAKPCQPTTHITPLSPWRGVGGEAFTPWRGVGGEAFTLWRGFGGEVSTFWREVGGEAFVNLSARLLTL